MQRVNGLGHRLAALEARSVARGMAYRTKAERDALVAAALADPANEVIALAGLPKGDLQRRAAVSAAFRADS